MNLPDFITRMLGFADKVESKLLAAAGAELTTAQARITALESELVEARAAQSTFEVQIKDLNAAVELNRTERDASRAEVVALKAELETAKAEAGRIIASQGLPLDRLPAAQPEGATNNELVRLRASLSAATDPKEKYRISQAIKAITNPAK